jgi:hypothetical protein
MKTKANKAVVRRSLDPNWEQWVVYGGVKTSQWFKTEKEAIAEADKQNEGLKVTGEGQ